MWKDLMKRRDFLKCLSAAAGAMGFAGCLESQQPSPEKPRYPRKLRYPNIVLIMADDMGYGDIGCYNPASKIPTPNMDALASRGMRFTDAHSPSAVCTPTRYGILTGRYCWRTRLKQGVLGGYSPPLIEQKRLTIPSMLKQRGYSTACIGKWHVGAQFHDKDGKPTSRENRIDFSKPITGGPHALGFEYAWFTAGCGTVAPPYGFIENDRFVDTQFSYYDSDKTAPHVLNSSGMMGASWRTRDADVVIADKACKYIQQQSNRRQPFFLYLTPNAPHEPCVEEVVPEFARRKSSAGSRGDLVWLFDWIVGKVVNALKKTRQIDNTLIIVTSDNGALPGDFLLDKQNRRVARKNRNYLFKRYGHKSTGDLRGFKAHIWEGGHREPLIASWPGKIQPDTVSDELVCLTDFMATLADITAVSLPNNAAEDSASFLPILTGDKSIGRHVGKPIREAIVHHSSYGVFSIRQGKWKLILETKGSGGWPVPRGGRPQQGTPGQLYDIDKDPAEQTDLWKHKPDIVARLTRLLEKYKATGRSVPARG